MVCRECDSQELYVAGDGTGWCNAKGDYFAMNSKNMKINDFNLIEEYVR